MKTKFIPGDLIFCGYNFRRVLKIKFNTGYYELREVNLSSKSFYLSINYTDSEYRRVTKIYEYLFL